MKLRDDPPSLLLSFSRHNIHHILGHSARLLTDGLHSPRDAIIVRILLFACEQRVRIHLADDLTCPG